MGRSGGGGGGFSGGGRSGGFSGGGRRSGGFSGGGRPSGGRSGGLFGGFGGRPAGRPAGGPPPGGGFAPPRPHVHVPFFGGFGGFGGFGRPVAAGPGYAGGSGCGCGGCLGGLMAIVVVALIFALLSTSLSTCSGPAYGDTAYVTSGTQSSDTVREKLPADAVTKTDYYTDADGDWIHDAGRLTQGLEEFYDKTGVQPYVYILPNGESTSTTELTALAERLYPELFTDEGHFLLVFCDDGNGTFNCGYTVGTAASAVMDSEAVNVLADELDYAYNNADTDEEVFSDAFSETAGRIMAAAEDEQRGQTTMLVVGGVVLVIAVGGAIAYVVKRRKAKQDEERQRMEDILNTPLEKFGDKDVEDLAGKYEDKD